MHTRRGLGRSQEARAWAATEFGAGGGPRRRRVAGGLVVQVARELGFCYGVERAVDHALQTRLRFPERRVFLTGAMVHNPGVNRRLTELGIQLVPDLEQLEAVGPGDVAILPAFGCPLALLQRLEARGCLVVDTTCGSVLVVWKHVERWARAGMTVLLHGKLEHEETRATCSRVTAAGGRWLVLRDLDEVDRLCELLRGERPAGAIEPLLARVASPGFRADRDLRRLGCANQTTMLASESAEVAARVRRALEDRHGPEGIDERFAALDTICSATQDRQDALRELLELELDLLLVVGGFDSSNTGQLARIGAARCPTYHVEGAAGLLSPRAIRHQPAGGRAVVTSWGWLPEAGRLQVGLTAGASTPPGDVERVIARLDGLRREGATRLGRILPTRSVPST